MSKLKDKVKQAADNVQKILNKHYAAAGNPMISVHQLLNIGTESRERKYNDIGLWHLMSIGVVDLIDPFNTVLVAGSAEHQRLMERLSSKDDDRSVNTKQYPWKYIKVVFREVPTKKIVSAYELAAAGGFKGTESEYLESLTAPNALHGDKLVLAKDATGADLVKEAFQNTHPDVAYSNIVKQMVKEAAMGFDLFEFPFSQSLFDRLVADGFSCAMIGTFLRVRVRI